MNWVKRLNTYGVSNWVILLLFVLSLFSMLAQIVGLGIFLPIFEYIFQDGLSQTDDSQNMLLKYINLLITTMNLSVSLESLLITAFLFYFISMSLPTPPPVAVQILHVLLFVAFRGTRM